MVFPSQEVRWFFEGGVEKHNQLAEWYVDSASYEKEDGVGPAEWRERTDRYLRLPDVVDMGLKWREGQLQIKGRQALVGVSLFGAHAGLVERWIKWSYKGPDIAGAVRPLMGGEGEVVSPTVVDVHKKRALRKFRLGGDPPVAEVDPGPTLARGISFELTDLAVGEASWSTLGFEAFPDDSLLFDEFGGFVRRILASFPGPSLEAADSLSYPQWLVERA